MTHHLQLHPSTSKSPHGKALHGMRKPANQMSKNTVFLIQMFGLCCSSVKAAHSRGLESTSSSDSESSSSSDSDGESAIEEPPQCPGSSSMKAEVHFIGGVITAVFFVFFIFYFYKLGFILAVQQSSSKTCGLAAGELDPIQPAELPR